MGDYIKQLRRASFRGISFDIPSDETEFGRRVITDEYPGRDTPSHEDMGAGLSRFSVTAIIGGAAFIQKADSLQAALSQSGAGTLVHPYHGELQVIVVGKPRRQHNNSAVGLVKFVIEFEIFGEPVFPATSLDTLGALSGASDNLLSALRGDFISRFVTASLPDFVSMEAIKQASGWVSTIEGAMASGGFLSLLRGDMPAWSSIGLGVVDDVTSLFDRVKALVKPLKKPVVGTAMPFQPQRASTVMGALNEIIATSPPAVSSTATSLRPVRQRNGQALEGLFRGCAAAACAEVAMHGNYESKEEALHVRGQSYDSLSALRDMYGRHGWDDSWRATGQLIAALHRDINERIGRLPATVRVSSGSVRSSLSLAHRLYGDALPELFDNADDIVRRNGVRHPGFVPAARLEVLIDT